MQAFYDNQPKKLEAVGNGSFRYRYNIREEEKPVQASENSETAQEAQAQTQERCGYAQKYRFQISLAFQPLQRSP